MIVWQNNHKKNEDIIYYEVYILNINNKHILDYQGKTVKLNLLLSGCEKDGELVYREKFEKNSLSETEKLLFTLRYDLGQSNVRILLEEIQKALISGAFVNKEELEYYNDRHLTVEIEKSKHRFKPFFYRDHKLFGEKIYEHDPIEQLRGRLAGDKRHFAWRIMEAFTSFRIRDYGFLKLDFLVKKEEYYAFYSKGEIKELSLKLLDFLSEQIVFKEIKTNTKLKNLEKCAEAKWWLNFLKEIRESAKEVQCFDHRVKASLETSQHFKFNLNIAS